LGGAAQASEWILDLVRELANHQAAAIEARQEIVLAGNALLLRCIRQLEQQVRACYLAFERRNGDVQRSGFATRRADGPTMPCPCQSAATRLWRCRLVLGWPPPRANGNTQSVTPAKR